MDELLFINFLVLYIYYIFIWCLIFEVLYILRILIPQTYHWQIILPFTFLVFIFSHWLFLPWLSRHFLLNFMLSHSLNHGRNFTEVLYQSPWPCLYLSILLYKFYSFRGYLKVLAHMQWFLCRMTATGLISLSCKRKHNLPSASCLRGWCFYNAFWLIHQNFNGLCNCIS